MLTDLNGRTVTLVTLLEAKRYVRSHSYHDLVTNLEDNNDDIVIRKKDDIIDCGIGIKASDIKMWLKSNIEKNETLVYETNELERIYEGIWGYRTATECETNNYFYPNLGKYYIVCENSYGNVILVGDTVRNTQKA